MVEFRIDYSHQPDALLFLGTNHLENWQIRWIEKMDRENRLKDAVEELRAERASVVRKLEEIDGVIQALESRIVDKNGSLAQTVILHNKEFSDTGIAEAAQIMIRRARRPLHARDIAKGLIAGGYRFGTTKPMNSVAPVLYLAAKKGAYGLVPQGRNVFSLAELEEEKK